MITSIQTRRVGLELHSSGQPNDARAGTHTMTVVSRREIVSSISRFAENSTSIVANMNTECFHPAPGYRDHVGSGLRICVYSEIRAI